MPSERRFAEVRSVLERHGWTLDRIKGSHYVFSKEGQSIIVVPVHKNRVQPAYIRQIEKTLGIRF